MFWARLSSLRWRLALVYAGLVLAVTALLTGIAVRTAAVGALTAQQGEAGAAVRGVAMAFADALARSDVDPVQVARQQGLAAGGRVIWLGADGTVQVDGYGDPALSGRMLSLPAGLMQATAPRAGVYAAGGGWVAYAVAPLQVGGRASGQVLLVRDLGSVQQELAALRRRLWLWGAGLTSAGLIAGLLFANWLTQPLERLTAAVRRMRAGDLRQSVPAAGGLEIAHLAAAFNDMASRVATLDEQRRAFVANAAHELRTPLAALHVLAESMAAGPEPVQPEIDGFIRQTERLGRLVNSLLALAKLDNPEIQLRSIALRVPNLLQEARWIIKPLAAARQVQIELPPSGTDVWVQGDPDWLQQALVNALDNAVRYTPVGGWVRVHTRVEHGLVHITVLDSGPGVPSAALARLGTRFFRVEAARERSSGGTAGSGLGLAIASEVLRRHGGRLWFASPPGQGLTVHFELPAAAPEPGDLTS